MVELLKVILTFPFQICHRSRCGLCTQSCSSHW